MIHRFFHHLQQVFRIGAGGAGLPATDGSHDRDGWVRTDTWSFRDSCQTPTTYAIEGVDSEGVAALD